MELTKSEREIADRYLTKREKQLAEWPYRRWVIIAIFSTFAFFGHRTVNDGMRTIREDQFTEAYISREAREVPPPGQEQRQVIGTMLKIGKILELRQQEVAYALLEIAIGYLGVISGAIMITLTILRWKTDERDTLICKLLRRKLQELEPDAALNASQPAQSPTLT